MDLVKRLVCACFLFVIHACGGAATAPSPDVSGNWRGTYALPSENPGSFSLQLTQSGLSITGSARLTQNEFVDVPATWTATLTTSSSPATMQFVMAYAFGSPACAGAFRGTLTVTPPSLDGSFTGENCTRTFAGSLHAEKVD